MVSTGESMNKIQIITMGASDDKLVSIRETLGEAAMRFFADHILGSLADSFMTELHDTGEVVRVLDGWNEMCMIEVTTDKPIMVQESHDPIAKDDFVNALNQDVTTLLQVKSS
jgi:hypothetical protein